MSVFGKIISDYEAAKVDNYFKPKPRAKDYAFRIVEPEKTIHGVQIFVEEEVEINGELKKVQKPKRFLPENRRQAQTWGDKVQDFISLHIWVKEEKNCFIFTATQASIIKSLIAIIKEVGEENLSRVTFLLNKQGEGKDTRYALNVVKDDDANIALSDLPAEATALAAQKPVNMLALWFNDRPWDNDNQYDLRTLDQSAKPCPPALAKAVSDLPAGVRSSKRVAAYA